MLNENEELSMYQQFEEDTMENTSLIKIEEKVANFEFEVYDPKLDESKKLNLSSFKGKWLVLFFYPADRTFVCPTELKDLKQLKAEFDVLKNVEILVVSTDTTFSHKLWIETEKLLSGFDFKMISDRKTTLSRYFGILNQNSGNAERGTFIISPNMILKSVEVITEPVGRSGKELLRKLKALKYVSENQGVACPGSWNNEDPFLRPSIKIAGKVGDNLES